jgi:hypothetical protein
MGYLNQRLLALPPSDPHASQDIFSFCGAAPRAADAHAVCQITMKFDANSVIR